MKIELSNIMYSQQLEGIKFFESKSPKFIASLAPLLKPVKIAKGEYIYLKGDSIDGLYFIKKGELAYTEQKLEVDITYATKARGSIFGDIDFVNSQIDS